MSENEPNGWGEWSRHVLLELKRLNASLERAVSSINENSTKINTVDNNLKNKNDMCGVHRDELKILRADVAKNKEKIMAHRLITAAISAGTSILTALIVALAAMKGHI